LFIRHIPLFAPLLGALQVIILSKTYRYILFTIGEYREYGNERFLLYDNSPNSNNRILMFATDNYLSLLSKSDTWFVDGNFGLAPEFFKQLYVIRVQINSVIVTAVYCILQKKNQSTYEEIFRVILKECETRDLYPDPLYLHLDFEIAVINAAKNIFGSHITINGCFYHLCQSTHRKIQKLGLSEIYKKDGNFRKFCGMLDGLAFLPQDKVLDGMACLKEIMPPDAEDLLTYFDSYYVNGSYRRVGSASTLHFRKIPPIFSPSTWNVHNTTLVGGHRTNNMTEGWNNRFAKLCGHKHPTIWKLIRKIKMEISADDAKLALDAIGDSRTIRKLGQTRTIETRLKNLCIQIQADKISVLDFLTAVSHNIRKRCD